MRNELVRDGPTSDLHIGPRRRDELSYFDGKFYQPDTPDETQRRRNVVAPYLDAPLDANTPFHPGYMTLDTYQDWVELDWKVPHGSYDAVERFGAKLWEEGWDEAVEEIHAACDAYQNGESVPNREHLVEELGDVYWVVTALASNAGVSINDAVKKYLHREDVISLRSYDKLQMVTVDYIVTGPSPFVPGVQPFEKYNDYADFDEYSAASKMQDIVAGFHLAAQKQYGYGTDHFVSTYFEMCRRDMEEDVGQSIVTLAYIARRWAGATLAEMAQTNMRKLSSRVAANLIDKSDGKRPEKLDLHFLFAAEAQEGDDAGGGHVDDDNMDHF